MGSREVFGSEARLRLVRLSAFQPKSPAVSRTLTVSHRDNLTVVNPVVKDQITSTRYMSLTLAVRFS